MQKDNKPYSILLVEDNPGDALLVKDYLEENILEPKIVGATCFADASAQLHAGPS